MATAAQGRHYRVRMMQTIQDPVDMSSRRLDLREHGAVKPLQHFGLEMPLGNSWLVGDDGHAQAQVIQQTDGFGDTR